jgi:UDPglucose 6-dehydrogenase
MGGNTMKISVIGLGKLGACSAACFAYKGFDVIGIDINEKYVNDINNGVANVIEPQLQELITISKDRLKATKSYEDAIKETDISFLILPTPSKEDGHFSDKFLIDALTQLSAYLKNTPKDNHIFVIVSTVSPGTIEERLIPIIENTSGRKLNKGFEICYNPEFIALGSVIKDFLNPDMVLIGESSKNAGDIVQSIYEKTCDNKPYFARMSLISAEITKISLNSYITMKISFANTLANLCERIPGSEIDKITKAIGSDKRVSPYYLKGGLPFGGPCFPRDNRAFAAFAQKYDYDAILAKSTDKVNQLQINNLINLVSSNIKNSNDVIGIIGLAYKPNTPVIEESPAIKVINELLKKDLKIIAYDPLAHNYANTLLGYKILFVSTLKDLFQSSDVVVYFNFFDELQNIENLIPTNKTITFIDCWRNFDSLKNSPNIKLISLGVYQKHN